MALVITLACSGPQLATPTGTPLQRAIDQRDQGHLAQAQAALTRLLADGDQAAALPLAETLMLRGQHAQAVELLKPRLQAHLQDPELAGALARALDGAGLPQEAIAAYARRLTLLPDDAEAAVRMAELLLSAGDAAHASQVATAGLKLHPDHAMLLLISARTLLARGRVPQALEAAHKATNLQPQSSESWLRLGEILMMAGELEAAQVAFERCLSLDPQHPEALREVGAVLVERGQLAKAVQMLKKSLAVAPESTQAWVTLAVAHQRDHAYGDAESALEEAVRLQPKSAPVHRFFTEVLLEDGLPTRALQQAQAGRNLVATAKTTDAPLLQEYADLVSKVLIVQAMSAAVCSHDKDAAGLEARIAHQLQAEHIQQTPSQVAEVAQASAAAIKAATNRCSTKAK